MMTNKDASANEIEKLPKSAKRIIALLNEHYQLTQKKIIIISKLKPKTVRYGMMKLKNLNLIYSLPNYMDMRSNYYQLSPTITLDALGKITDQVRDQSVV